LIALPERYPTAWAIAWTALLLVLCLAPARVLPEDESIVIKRFIPHTDLAVHFTLFAVFVASWIRAGRSPLRWVVIPALGLLLAVGTECAQGIPSIHRDPNLLDGLTDALGVAAGLVGSIFGGRQSHGAAHARGNASRPGDQARCEAGFTTIPGRPGTD
jgi:hypothetical protein